MVHLVDDDPAVLQGLTMALELAGFHVRAYQAPAAFLAQCDARTAGCLVIDLRMPGMDGLAVQRALKERRHPMPIIFISALGSIHDSVAAVREGAVDFLEKPFEIETLIARIEEALQVDRECRERLERASRIQRRLASLTPREREIMSLITIGLSNKLVARRLGISHRTVEHHRAQVMEKMDAANLADLCQMCTQSGL